jgi:peptide/nickel transport system permease protein
MRVSYAAQHPVRRRPPPFALGFVVLLLAVAALPQAFGVADPLRQNLAVTFTSPGIAYPMGTDHLGRDVMSRVVHGTRTSVLVGLVSVALALSVGCVAGLFAAFRGGLSAALIMRSADAALAMPAVLLALAVGASVGPSVLNVILIISFVFWPIFARIVFLEARGLRERDFVLAAVSCGSSLATILRRHILPHVATTLVVLATIQLAAAMLLEAILSFLGVGVPPPTPSWGGMVADGRSYVTIAWWVVAFPSLAIMLTCLSFNLLGDWLRDRLDPRSGGLR